MNLTEEQSRVVAIAEGRHLVLAPPGSGKTEMLSARIARALASGVDPKRMLCATFTNRAAFEMRERVGAACGGRELPDVGNLHHFCQIFLRSVGKLHPGKHVLDEVDQLEFVKEVVDPFLTDEAHPRWQELLTEHFAKCREKEKNPYVDLLAAVQVWHMARLGIARDLRRKMPVTMAELARSGLVAAVEPSYEGLKRKFQSVDFDDLLVGTYRCLEAHPLDENRRYLWVQIDEVQDLNPLQWEIVRRLTARQAVSVYFGDVEQAIFSFLGASARAFREATVACTRHYFKTNFRATPKLLEVLMRYSLTTLKSEWEFLPVPVDLAREDGVVEFLSDDHADPVARAAQLLRDGTAENVAILVRQNATAEAYAKEVAKLGVRYTKVSGYDLFTYRPMREFLAFLSLFAQQPPRTAWATLFACFSSRFDSRMAARYFVRTMFAAGYDPRTLLTGETSTRGRLWSLRHAVPLREVKRGLRKAYREVARRGQKPMSFREVFGIFVKTGYIPKEERTRALARIEKFLRYTDHVYRRETRSFLQVLAEDGQQLAKLKEADLLVGDERIVISTIHKAKGRQFDAVIVPSTDDVLKPAGPGEPLELERLLYVALSRAKRHLITYGSLRVPTCDYYRRKQRGEDLSADWLDLWERLADCLSTGEVSPALLEQGLASPAEPVLRLCVELLGRQGFASQKRLLGFLNEVRFVPMAERVIRVLSEAGAYSEEFQNRIEAQVLETVESAPNAELIAAAVDYFAHGVAQGKVSPDRLAIFLYVPWGNIRRLAAQVFAEQGVAIWSAYVTGGPEDFEALGRIAAPEHEPILRRLLERKLERGYETEIRALLRRRAKLQTAFPEGHSLADCDLGSCKVVRHEVCEIEYKETLLRERLGDDKCGGCF